MRLVFLSVILAAGVFYTYYAFSNLTFLSPTGRPGPGFFPRLVGSGMVFLTLACIVGDLRKVLASEGGVVFSKGQLPHGAIFIIIMGIGYAFTLRYLGGVLSTVLFLLITLSVLNQGRYLQNIAVAIGVPLAIYVLFRQLLNASMPQGLLSLPF